MLKNLLLLITITFSINTFAQSTNTKKWRKTENDSMQQALLLYEEANYLIALPIYEKLYLAHPKEDYLKYCYGKCALYRSDKHEMALTLLYEVYEKNKKVENIEYDLARAAHYNLLFDDALALIDKCLLNKHTSTEIKKEVNQLKNYCINAKLLMASPTAAKIENIGNVLNTSNEEYVPIISADESIMIYTYKGTESMGGLQNALGQPDKYGIYYEDVYQSTKENNQWTKPKPITSINTNSHDGAIALSADGQQLFVYRDNGDDHGDIYLSRQKNGEWSTPEKLKGQVNSYSWEGSCSMTADGKQLYFSSERGGGFGGKDIYRATLLPDSTWGNVINLGDSINTALDDDAPFIHPDGVTLFYSSKAKNSMGGYDIFQSRLNWMDSTFSKPVNLGYPINTPDEDIYYVLSANGERGYYSSGKKGGEGLKDVYTVYPGYVGKKPSVYIVKGKITESLAPIASSIIVEIINKDNKIFGEFKSDGVTGNYLISLPAGGNFKLTYKYKDFAPKLVEINTLSLEGYDEKIVDFNYVAKDTTPVVAIVPIKDTVVAVVKEPLVKEPKIKTSTSSATEPVVKKDAFVAKSAIQEKTQLYVLKYSDVSAEGLIFKVQIAAYKYPKNYVYEHLKALGDIENILLDDGITRITIGGSFPTLGAAFEHSKKVIAAGQKDAFVTVLYKGKRIFLEELETFGIFAPVK
jgi:WD40-like Beta Propeller Repeat